METKEFYELRSYSIKTKYKNKINEIVSSNKDTDIEYIKRFKEEALEDIKQVKKEKNNQLKSYQKRIKLVNIITDIVVFLGIALFSIGLYLYKKNIEDLFVLEILCMVFGGVCILASAFGFGLVMYAREQRTKFFKESISEAEIASTKSMVVEFCDTILEKENI